MVTKVLAHRGVSAYFPENTREALAAAGPAGADGVEFDVRRTSDEVLVVHHDPRVGAGLIAELPAAALDSSIPTLAEAIEASAGLEIVNVEIKNLPWEPGHDPHEHAAAQVATLLAARDDRERFLVSSFSWDTIQAVRAIAPEVATGALVLVLAEPEAVLARIAAEGHVAVHPEHSSIDDPFMKIASDVGLAVHAWTVDDPERVAQLAQLGVASVITNDPARARAGLSR